MAFGVAVAMVSGVGEEIRVAVAVGSGVDGGAVIVAIGLGEARQAVSTSVLAAPTNPRRTNWRRLRGVKDLLIDVSPQKIESSLKVGLQCHHLRAVYHTLIDESIRDYTTHKQNDPQISQIMQIRIRKSAKSAQSVDRIQTGLYDFHLISL
jgi:hypothetical protein